MRYKRGKLVAIMTAATMAAALTACSGRGSDANAEGDSGGGDIVIRASYPLSGPLASAGASAAGAQAYFDAVNADGGINGRKIDFKVSDDAFDPARMVSNNREFVQKDKASIVINFGGISLAARPVLNEGGVAQIVQGGEQDLSDVDEFPYTRAFVPDIAWEGELQGRYITENHPDATVGFMGFNNAFSDSQLAGLAAAGINPVKALRLPPGQGDITSQVTEMKSAGVDLLVVTLGPPTMGALMKYMGQIDYQPTTFIGAAYADFSSTVNPAGAENVKGALSYQWFKDPQNPEVESDPGVEQFKADMSEYAPDGDATSTFTYTGYGLAAAIVSALSETDDVSSDGFLKSWDAVSGVENPLLVKGAALTAESDGRLVHQYQLNEFNGTSWVPQGDVLNVVDEGIAK